MAGFVSGRVNHDVAGAPTHKLRLVPCASALLVGQSVDHDDGARRGERSDYGADHRGCDHRGRRHRRRRCHGPSHGVVATTPSVVTATAIVGIVVDIDVHVLVRVHIGIVSRIAIHAGEDSVHSHL